MKELSEVRISTLNMGGGQNDGKGYDKEDNGELHAQIQRTCTVLSQKFKMTDKKRVEYLENKNFRVQCLLSKFAKIMVLEN